MGKIGDVYYVVGIDSSGLPQLAKKEGDKAGKAFGTGMTGSIKKNLKGGLAQGLGVGAALGGIGAVTLATGKLVEVLGDSIDAASNQREAMSLGAQVFEHNAGEMEKWAQGAADAFGQSTTEALTFASNFGNAFKNVGFALDEASDKSRVMTELAADLGSAFNAGADEAALALRSGLLGESEPLRRFGVFLDEAKVKAKAVQLGIAKLGDTLSDNQKVTARYALIMEQTADSQGMFGRDTSSLADAQKSLEAAMENLSAELGEVLLPFMTDLVQTVRDEVVPALEDFIGAMKDTGDAVTDNSDPIINLANILHDLFKDEEQPAKTFLGTLFDGLNDVAEASNNLGRNINDAVTFWDGYTDAAEDSAKAQSEVDETAREAGRGIDVVAASAEDAEPPVKDLGDTGADTGRKLKRAGEVSTVAWRDFAAAIIDEARGRIDQAYQIIEDRAALAAANVETAELAKVIATGDATQEQKDDYTDLGETQAGLILDLAENGVKGGKVVNTAVEQMRTRLKTASGNEKKAIQILLDTINKVGPAARAQYNAISRLVAKVRPLGLPSGPQERHSGGPVQEGVPYVVGRTGAEELFVPDTSGYVYPDVPAGMGAMSTTTNEGGVTINLVDRGVGVSSVREIASVTKSLRRQGYF